MDFILTKWIQARPNKIGCFPNSGGLSPTNRLHTEKMEFIQYEKKYIYKKNIYIYILYIYIHRYGFRPTKIGVKSHKYGFHPKKEDISHQW